ncbi:MAG: enoyl-CoA hydratase/isomerase family protein, partial [Oxalobacteraceae bacterium]
LESLRAADRDSDINAVVLTGAGKSFCAGADTTEFSTLTPDDPQAISARADLTTALHLVFSQMNKPVISAVRGNALGGGAGLAIACDLCVMSETVRFGYPELRHGIVAAVVMANLVRQAGRKQAFELVAMADPVDGAGAKALGLCNRVVPDGEVLDAALHMTTKIAGWSPIAMATTKRAFHRTADLGLASALEVGRDANVMMRGFRKLKVD